MGAFRGDNYKVVRCDGLKTKWKKKEKLLVNPLPDDKILDSSKLEDFADNNFKFHENQRKLSKQVVNTVGKGEIARYEQFLLFPQCFQMACLPGASKGVILWEWVKPIYLVLFSKVIPLKVVTTKDC